MREQQRALAAISAIAHIGLGIGIALDAGTVGSSPAWTEFDRILPGWFWPAVFVGLGLLAACGMVKLRLLRWSFYLGAIVMLAWSLGLLAAWLDGYGPQPSVIWLLYIGGLKYLLAQFGLRLDRNRQAIREITEEAQQRNGGRCAQ